MTPPRTGRATVQRRPEEDLRHATPPGSPNGVHDTATESARQRRSSRSPRLLHVFPSFDTGGVQVRFAALVDGFGGRFHHTVLSLGGGYEAADLLPPNHTVELAGDPLSAPSFARSAFGCIAATSRSRRRTCW